MNVTPTPLGEVATFIRGITFKPEDKVEIDSPDAVVCMRTKNVQDLIDQDDLIAIPPSFVNRHEQYLVEGDILVSTANSWELVGKSCWVPKIDYKATAGGFISILRANRERVFPRYLYHWMNSSETLRNLRYCGRQTTNISNMSYELACGLKIPLPPLPEQKRIAAILDKADSIQRKRQEAVQLTDELLSSVFLDMFGDPETNPKGVKVVMLSEITTRITDGVHQKPNYTIAGVPFISVKDITTGTLKFDNCKFVSLEDHQMFTKRCKAEQLDILYTKVGATYGRPAIVDTDREFSLYVSVCLIKPQRKLVDSYYLKAVLGTKAIKRQADKRIKGIGVPDLHLDQIQQILIPLPAMEEQREFARRVAAIEILKTSHNEALSELDTLFNSLLQCAFKGEL